MNSIEEKRNKTIHESQFDKTLQETKNQIEQICKGIEIKKHLGKNIAINQEVLCLPSYPKKKRI